ncbi:MAG: hypothetical protein EZS28_050319 [Streblomastix strix]|uniref:Uncharacterized protein n=1 Tax=Streblomastix strix TaxID=222440 RepID=A0A5J4T858_9EUKA|nr:MAG: hypothetical protein EZS28_050319 [Streblomastix strix]
MLGDRQTDEGSTSTTTSGKNESRPTDKHASGELLFREIGECIGLEDEAVSNIILSSSQETWRKRRAGLHLFQQYIVEKKLEVKQILTGKADVILANALTQLEKRGGKSVLQDMKKMKTHAGVALSMFQETRDVAQSPIVQAIVKRLNLDNEQKSKYQSIWNLSQLTRFILRERL